MNDEVSASTATGGLVKVPVRAHGPFAFSRQYDDPQVLERVWQATVWNTTVGTLPILPAWASKLNEDLIVRSIFGTAAIEGSSLSEPEVSALLSAGPVTSVKSDKEQVILNLRQAYRLAGVGERREPIPEPPPLSEARICELHGAITQGLDHDRYLPGAYRFGPVEVGDADHGGKYKPPKVPEDIKMLMARFVEWANSPELTKGTPPVVRAFLVHYHLALIHPFRDGNGRLARVLEAELLEQARFRYVSLMMSNFYYERIDDYYRAFSAAEQNSFNLTPFLVFCLDGLVQSLTSIHFRVTEQIRRLALRKHCDDLKRARKLSWRRHGLLLLLLDDDRPFTAADLKSEPRFAALYGGVSDLAVWRDLRRLQEMSLLVPADAGRLRVNLRVLG